jgi:hypothetical protein
LGRQALESPQLISQQGVERSGARVTEDEKIAALEKRIVELEAYVEEANKNFVKFQEWVYGVDGQYQEMMGTMLRKYDTVRRFAETAGPMLLECFDLLFPERAGTKARDLNLIVRGSEEIN